MEMKYCSKFFKPHLAEVPKNLKLKGMFDSIF